MAKKIKILETFRDAIQGMAETIPTDTKIDIINSLLEVGFDYLDIGSYVSAKLIPQFADMDEVIEKINEPHKNTKLFALVANEKGASMASRVTRLDVLGYPFSTSETFLKKNINSNFDKSWRSVNKIQNTCVKTGKDLMVYLAMAFGNPYNDPVSIDICVKWTEKFVSLGVKNIHLSDIIGVATPIQIEEYYEILIHEFPEIEFGIHLHISEGDWYPKIQSAFNQGCHIFDGVISGLGGCPMTGYELLKNLPTSNLLEFAQKNNILTSVDSLLFEKSKLKTHETLFNNSTY